MLPLTIAIIAKNEAHHLRRLLPRLVAMNARIAVVIDSTTTDDSEAVCMEYGATVRVEPWRGSIEQKNAALATCSGDWVWSLDADEFPDDDLCDEVARFIASGTPGAALIRRRTVYMGKTLRFAWQPDIHLRLVHTSLNPRFINERGHDKMSCDRSMSTTLKGWMDHHSFRSVRHHFEKTVYYAQLGADDYHARGRSATVLNLLVNPMHAWFKMSVLRGALLDGLPGVLAGLSAWLHVFLKYAMLLEKRRMEKHRNGRPQ
ncbi:MAG: glycosyltransferase family 2 protein [Candidatus Kapaibacterium sp.]